ncbi:ERF family protein [Salipiger thiooxidans]|uniref:ERF family protein n=1 Tax=Salipiger thiooxidans TaxID=282683 RepID=UPI001A8E7F86|nr:ERF family protein [Salipiger thiooxidans]MBN8189512.1 ERF family protein [Salipiger thiooxidans]
MNAVTDTKASHGSIATALAAAQSQMGKALKSANNPHFKSKYADLSSVMDACLPALNQNGIAVVQPSGEDEVGRYVETVLIHGETGQSLSCRVPLIVQKNDMQGYGSAVTYARRYGLMSMAGIAPEDDDGNAAAKAAPTREQRNTGPSREAIRTACGSLSNADGLEQLRAIWSDLPKAIQSVPEVITAKDARKAALDGDTDQATDHDPIDDEIPHQ